MKQWTSNNLKFNKKKKNKKEIERTDAYFFYYRNRKKGATLIKQILLRTCVCKCIHVLRE